MSSQTGNSHDNCSTTIVEDDLSGTQIKQILLAHLKFTGGESPPQSMHALDLDELKTPDITVWSARQKDVLVGCVALKMLTTQHGEIKSMHTTINARGRGIAKALLEHLMQEARRRDCYRLSLETGSMEAFKPARSLYASFGFESCGPFGDYVLDPYSVFMTRSL